MPDRKSLESVFSHIEENTEQIVADLQELCRQPSISATHVGIEEMATLLQERLERTGFQTARHETAHNPIITGVLPGTAEKTLLFYNHYDVQPVEPLEEWTSPPFEARVVDGHVISRGATDNKGNIISRLAAFEAFLSVHGELPCEVKHLIEGNEEGNSPSLLAFIEGHKELLMADGCIWEDTFREDVPVLALGNKGMCYLELRCQTANVDFHSSQAQIYENAAWRLVWALSTMKGPNEEVLIEGFYDDVVPLTEKEEEMLGRIKPYDSESRKKEFDLRRFVLDLTAEELPRRHLTQPTLNIAGIDGGYTKEGSKTIVAGKARAKLDCRLVMNQNPERIYECIRRHLDRHGFRDIEMEMLGPGSVPAKSDPESNVVKACQAASRRVYGADPVVNPFGDVGSTPAWMVIRHLGLPTVGTGVGYITARTHGADENLKIEYLIDGAKYMAAICAEFALS